MSESKGAYIFNNKQSKSIDLFLFIKCSSDDLKKSLPLSYNELTMKTHNCLVVIINNGVDYLGSGCLDDVPNLILEKNMVNLLNNSYEFLNTNGFKYLTLENYNNMINFAKKQLKI